MNAVGLLVLFGCVFGGYIMAGGKMAPIIKAAPIETFIIAGAAAGAMLVGNSMVVIKSAMGGLGKVFKGSRYKKERLPGGDVPGSQNIENCSRRKGRWRLKRTSKTQSPVPSLPNTRPSCMTTVCCI